MILTQALVDLGAAAVFGDTATLCVAFADALQERGYVHDWKVDELLFVAGKKTYVRMIPSAVTMLGVYEPSQPALCCASCEGRIREDRTTHDAPCCTLTIATQRWACATLAVLLFGEWTRTWPVAERCFVAEGGRDVFLGFGPEAVGPAAVVLLTTVSNISWRIDRLHLANAGVFDVEALLVDDLPVDVHSADIQIAEGSLSTFVLDVTFVPVGAAITLRVRNRTSTALTLRAAVSGPSARGS